MNRAILSLKNIDKTYGKNRFSIIFPLILNEEKHMILSVKMVLEDNINEILLGLIRADKGGNRECFAA